MTRILVWLALVGFAVIGLSAAIDTPSREDALLIRTVELYERLAQTSAALAACEANGSQFSQWTAQADAAKRALAAAKATK